MVVSLSVSKWEIFGVLIRYLWDHFQGARIFRLNKVEVKMGLKDVAIISRLNVVSPIIRPRPSHDELTFKNRLFRGVR